VEGRKDYHQMVYRSGYTGPGEVQNRDNLQNSEGSRDAESENVKDGDKT
jgi:hypothetical protein